MTETADTSNLRGALVQFALGGRSYTGTVIAYLRDDLWRIQWDDRPGQYPRKITLHRAAFNVIDR